MGTKRTTLIFLFVYIIMGFLQAEEIDNSAEINRINSFIFGNNYETGGAGGAIGVFSLLAEGGVAISNPNAITEDQAIALVRQFIVNKFGSFFRPRDLNVSEISLTADYNRSTENLIYLNVSAKFTNAPINNRIYNGRLETTLTMRPPEQRRILRDRDWRIDNGDNKDMNIKLLVDDQLTDELRQAMTTDYVRNNYNNPIDVKIYNERTEIYGNRVYSYVSAIVNNDSIVYLRVVFEKQKTPVENTGIFSIEGSQWLTNRAEIIFNKKFPDIRDRSIIKVLGNEFFAPISFFHARTQERKSYLEKGSGIRSIGSITLLDATNGLIRLEIETTYRLDYSGFIGSYADYDVKINAYFEFDIDKGVWIFNNLEDIESDNIRFLKK